MAVDAWDRVAAIREHVERDAALR